MLLGHAEEACWALDLEALYQGLPSEDGSALVASFDQAKIKRVLDAMDRSSAPAPMGSAQASSVWLGVW